VQVKILAQASGVAGTRPIADARNVKFLLRHTTL
jgi:hypothetical protein